MGTLILFEEKIEPFVFEGWSSTSDLSYPEYGFIDIFIEGNGEKYRLNICVADYSDKWINNFINAFISHANFREQFNEKNTSDNKHVTELVILNNKEVEIDKPLVKAILKLNEIGAITDYCCQGDTNITPYICLKSGVFPEELIQAWKGADFNVNIFSVYANGAVGVNMSHLFIQSLDDWINNQLDLSGQKYSFNGIRPSSLPQLPSAPNVALTSQLHHLVNKGKKAKFKDFVNLKSGRDHLSSKKLPDLITLCHPEDVLQVQSTFSDNTTQASALRWILRGLPVDMAIHKIKVDLEINANAKQYKK